jgi:hypothetical protein
MPTSSFTINNFKIALIIMLVHIWCSYELSAQRFGTSLALGLNMSQIDGDNSYGYNKAGLNGGLRLQAYTSPKTEFETGILYSRQGSQSRFLDNSLETMRIDLHYIQVPLELHYKDWLQESDYHKIHFLAGLNYSRLFNFDVRDGGFGVAPDQYNQNDISWTVGAAYLMNKRSGLALRYTRSFTLLYNRNNNQGSVYRSMLGYFISLQLFFHL